MIFTSCKKPYDIWRVKLILEKEKKDIFKIRNPVNTGK